MKYIDIIGKKRRKHISIIPIKNIILNEIFIQYFEI